LVTLGGMGFGDWATEERATRCIDLCFFYAGLMGLIWAEHSFCGLLFYLGSFGLVTNGLTSLGACLGFFFERKQNFPLLNDAESSAITETRIGPPSDCLSYLGQPTHTLPYYKIVVIAGLKRN
jgi:hypothetical protein